MENEQHKDDLRLLVVEKLSTLTAAAFGLVAALAWNDAVQSLFKKIFGEQASIVAKFIYAVIITMLVVLITIRIGRLQNNLERKLEEKSNHKKDI